jgi:hypothetical protein
VLWAQSGDAPMTVFTFTPIVVILVYPEWICRAHTTLFGLPVRPLCADGRKNKHGLR